MEKNYELMTDIAYKNFNNNNYIEALENFKFLSSLIGKNNFKYNEYICNKHINNIYKSLENIFKIDKIYIINLARKRENLLYLFKNLNFINFQNIKIINGVDGINSNEVFNIINNIDFEKNNKYYSSFSEERKKILNSRISESVIGYILSHKKIFLDALTNKYKRILIFDDDIFFREDTIDIISNNIDKIPKIFKIFLLGSSEYCNRNENLYLNSCINNLIYHPITDLTCGSFAVIYDFSVYNIILEFINRIIGPYDNCILGELYNLYRSECYAFIESICIPDVSSSDIRNKNRNQENHSKKMMWSIKEYYNYKKPIFISIIVSDIISLQHITTLKNRIGDRIFINFFYVSSDGLRIIIPNHNNNIHIQDIIEINNKNINNDYITQLKIPYSDLILIWPIKNCITEQKILDISIKAIKDKNNTGEQNNIKFFLNTGINYIPGKHSVIIPTYRNALEIWPAIESALLQKNISEYEVLLINDNPNDLNFEEEIYSKYKNWKYRTESNAKLKIISHKKTRMASAARNTGIINSTGEFISFLDDDDLYLQNRLSSTNIIDNNLYGAVYCAYEKDKSTLDKKRCVSGDLSDRILLVKYNSHYMNSDTVTYHRNAIKKITGFNESYIRHQDLEFNVRFFENYQIKSVSQVQVILKNINTTKSFKFSLENLIKIKYHFLNDMKENIKSRGNEFVNEIIDTHTKDIEKFFKKQNFDSSIIKSFLQGIFQ